MKLGLLVYVRRMLWVQIPPGAALFLLKKQELSLGVVALLCLVSITDRSCSCTCMNLSCRKVYNFEHFLILYHLHVHVHCHVSFGQP